MNKTQLKLTSLTALGGALEFYDFTIYALFAPYLSHHFFPNNQPLGSLVNTFAIFALGYLARPLGGIVFGHLGDKYGRKTAFALAVFMMATSTLLMGCLPSYQRIGLLAPLSLTLLRLIQGFSVGGEIPGASVFTLEHVPEEKQGFSIGLIFMCITLGNTLGALVGLILTYLLAPNQMMAWGWRIPFIIGFGLGLISYVFRKRAIETPVFVTMQRAQKLHERPFSELWHSTNKSRLFVGFMMTALTSSIISLFLYLPTYLTVILKFDVNQGYFINVLSFLSFALFTGFFGFLSDKFSRERLLKFGAVGLMFCSYPLFYGLHHFGLMFIGVFILTIALFGGLVNGSYVVMISSIFPANLRFSGVGLSYSLGVAIFGGIAPLVFTSLIERFHFLESPALYIIFCAMMTRYGLSQHKKLSEDKIHINCALMS